MRALALLLLAILAFTSASSSRPFEKLKYTFKQREDVVEMLRELVRPFVSGMQNLVTATKQHRELPAPSPKHHQQHEHQESPISSPGLRVNPIECGLCKVVVGAIEPLLEGNASLAIIEPIAIQICELIKPECTDQRSCKDLCEGVIPEFTPEIIKVILASVLDPAEVCYLLQMCDAPPPPSPPPHYVPVPSNCSDHSGERAWPSWKLTTGTGYFVQMSDIHVDLNYTVGANSLCGEPLCCRTFDGISTNGSGAAYYGDYNCDTPLQTVDALFYHLSTLHPPPDFILYTGDDPPHDIWEQSREGNLLAITTLFSYMAKYFPDIPVLPTLGNHESFPVNQYEGPPADSWLYDPVAAAWAPWLCDDAQDTIKYGGYYTCRARPGLRVISLNTNLWMSGNYWLNANLSDFAHQLDWLKDTLHQAEQLNEQVVIIGHACSTSWFDVFSLPYLALIERFQSTVANQFFGHSHTSSFKLFFDNKTGSVPINVGYIAGSVTPYTSLNPVFRRYFYDRGSLARATLPPKPRLPRASIRVNRRRADEPFTLVQDIDAFWLDLASAGLTNSTDWTSHRYLYSSSYNLSTPLTRHVMDDFAHRMIDDDALFGVFLNHYYRNVTQPVPDTKQSILCDLFTAFSGQFDNCTFALGMPGAPRPNTRC